MEKAIKDLKAGCQLYRVWLHQAWYVLAAKYKRTMFGTLWIASQFVFTSLAFATVYGLLFHRNLHSFLPYAMLGNLSATYCLAVMTDGPELYIMNSAIIRNHAYPFTFFTFEFAARMLMLMGHNLVAFYLFMIVNNSLSMPTWQILPGLLIDTVILISWGTVIGMASARFRDLRFMLPYLSNMFFFLTPIYWPVDLLGEHKYIANYNPLYSLVSIIRMPLSGQVVPAINWHVSILMAVVGILVWFASFSLFRRRIPFWV